MRTHISVLKYWNLNRNSKLLRPKTASQHSVPAVQIRRWSHEKRKADQALGREHGLLSRSGTCARLSDEAATVELAIIRTFESIPSQIMMQPERLNPGQVGPSIGLADISPALFVHDQPGQVRVKYTGCPEHIASECRHYPARTSETPDPIVEINVLQQFGWPQMTFFQNPHRSLHLLLRPWS